MNTPLDVRRNTRQRWRQIGRDLRPWLFVLGLTAGLTTIFLFRINSQTVLEVALGDTSQQEILAPNSLTYTSDVLTIHAQEQAVAAVTDLYTSPDLSIGRSQNNQARAMFTYIDVVRADTVTDLGQRQHYLEAISMNSIKVSPEVALALLNFTATDYTAVKQDVLRIVEELMRQDIRPESVNEKQQIARRAVDFDLNVVQDQVVSALSPQFIVANTFFDSEATTQKRADAQAAVTPVSRRITKGERIVRVGELIDDEKWEMLNRLGLLQEQRSYWQESLSTFVFSLMSVVILVFYWQQFHFAYHEGSRYFLILAATILIFALLSRIMLSSTQAFWPYLFPIAALSMLMTVVFDGRLAILVTVLLATLVGRFAQGSLEFTVYLGAGGVMAVLSLRDVQRIGTFFRAGMFAALGHILVIIVFRLPQGIGSVELTTFVLVTITNGLLAAAVTLAGLFLIGSIFGVITTLQLQDLSRLDHPLLRELLRLAPGTYHHSIMVANLAEQAAERIKANSNLVRVGAFFHDVGKMSRPHFFTENQEGVNPHVALDPYSSARIIISHVSEGMEMAHRHRLPDRIQDFIQEHHGDRVLLSFYQKAREQAGDKADEVPIAQFQHKGPRPRSRESGIVQLADVVEATSSAIRPSTEADIERLVTVLIEDHIKEGQLENSGLTLGDIKAIRESFVETLQGRFHTRVRYPGNERLQSGTPAPVATPTPTVATIVTAAEGDKSP